MVFTLVVLPDPRSSFCAGSSLHRPYWVPRSDCQPQKLSQNRISTETFSETSCAVQEGATQPGTRKLLRFTFNTPNVGEGDLIVGAVYENPDLFTLSPCHGHYHFNEYADYRFWVPAAYRDWKSLRQANPEVLAEDLLDQHPELANQMVAGHKEGFCVIDVARASSYIKPNVSGPAYYRDCLYNQGISVGWADEYGMQLDGQWVDITGVPKGSYVLEVEVNAERFFEESNYQNNSAAITIIVK